MIRGLALLIAGVALFACGLVAPAIVGNLSLADEPPMDGGADAVAPRTIASAPSQLRANLDAIAPQRKLLLGGGDVLAVAASCPAAQGASDRCLTLYDLDDLSSLTLDGDLSPTPRSTTAGKPSERLQSLVDAGAITPVLRDFLRDAPPE